MERNSQGFLPQGAKLLWGGTDKRGTHVGAASAPGCGLGWRPQQRNAGRLESTCRRRDRHGQQREPLRQRNQDEAAGREQRAGPCTCPPPHGRLAPVPSWLAGSGSWSPGRGVPVLESSGQRGCAFSEPLCPGWRAWPHQEKSVVSAGCLCWGPQTQAGTVGCRAHHPWTPAGGRGGPTVPAPRTCTARPEPSPVTPFQPHLIQVNLALRILEIQLQVECRNPVLGDPHVSQVGHGVEVLGRTNREGSAELQSPDLRPLVPQ